MVTCNLMLQIFDRKQDGKGFWTDWHRAVPVFYLEYSLYFVL